jgi:AbrB family looped-hinge helix DNA binding protein
MASEELTMATLTVTERGQVTFRKEVLQHLGIKPGEKIEVELQPNGHAIIRAVSKKMPLRALQGFLKGKTNGKVLTIQEINDVIAKAGAAAGEGQ